jgi:hypothetical protein
MNIWAHEWTMDDGPEDVCGEPRKTIFTLHRHVEGHFEFYHMEIVQGVLCSGWEDAEFVKRGKAQLIWPSHLRLPPWPEVPNATIKQQYDDAITEVMDLHANSNTLRLEGDVEFPDESSEASLTQGVKVTGTQSVRVKSPRTNLVASAAGNHTYTKRVTFLLGVNAVENQQTGAFSNLLLVNVSSSLGAGGGPVDDGTAHGNTIT